MADRENNNSNNSNNSMDLYRQIELLNNKIEDYNFQLNQSGNIHDQYLLIEAIKSLHKEIKRVNLKLLPKAYKTGKQ